MCVYVCMCMCVGELRTKACVSVHLCMNMCVCACVCVHMCVYLYVNATYQRLARQHILTGS